MEKNCLIISMIRSSRWRRIIVILLFGLMITAIPLFSYVLLGRMDEDIIELNGSNHRLTKINIAKSMEIPQQRPDPVHWKFETNKTYAYERLKSWTTVAHHLPKHQNGPGEMGIYAKAIQFKLEIINLDHLRIGEGYIVPPEKSTVSSKLFVEQNYNLFASAAIPLNRSLRDVRPAECHSLLYDTMLPDASVIIIFHNEALPTLLRTIYSIINRSPHTLLREIILVDDDSDIEEYGNVLEKFVELLPVPVKLIRSEKRLGLVRARIMGAKHAKGNVLIFLDAHIECTDGWLEPLLHRIADDRSTVVCPVVDFLQVDNLAYNEAKVTPIGFHWILQLDWDPMPYESFYDKQINKTTPFHSPSMIGCAFAIDRQFFYEIGTYDEGLAIWGSENLELSLRTWMCGGRVEIVPCSHVGHLYRTSTYSFDGAKMDIIDRNNVRVAEVWMDEYKEYLYNVHPRARKQAAAAGDLSERKALREKLECKSFDWYLRTVYPYTSMNAVAIAMGEIRNKATGMCIQATSDGDVEMSNCHGNGEDQAFVYTKSNRILASSVDCLVADRETGFIYSTACSFNVHGMYFKYDEKKERITEMVSGKCLGLWENGDEDITNAKIYVKLRWCTKSMAQKWIIQQPK